MELQVKLVGGIQSCFVSLPLSLLHILQTGHYLPPMLAIELRSDERNWNVAWSGSASSSSSIEIAQQYADCIGLKDRVVVSVRILSDVPKATLVTIEPLNEDDWEILLLNYELAETDILKQVGVVHEDMRFPLWLHGQIVTIIVMSTIPSKPVVQLVPGTEVAVAPKRRKKQSPEPAPTITKALLRVQDLDSRFVQKCDQNGAEMGVVFTSGAFIHPETAKRYAFSALQSVVISPRLGSKESKQNPHSEGGAAEKEAGIRSLTDNQDCHQVVVHILLSELVGRGHVMLSPTLRLYLGAQLHSRIYLKGCNFSMKKDIPSVSVSPCQFRFFQYHDDVEKSGVETINKHDSNKSKDILIRSNSNTEMGTGDWSIHKNIAGSLSFISSHDGAKEISTGLRESDTKVDYINGFSTLLRMWYLAQLDTIISNGADNVKSLVVGSVSLIHLKVKAHKFPGHGNVHRSRSKNQADEPSVDVLYVLSLSEESVHEEDISIYELAFEKGSVDKYTSRSLDALLGKLQLGKVLCFHAAPETSPDDMLSAEITSLDGMGAAPSDVNQRLTALLSPQSGMLISAYNLPFPGHVLIYGPPGSGKTLLAKVSAKSVELCKDILAHRVFVPCSKLALEKPPTIRQVLSSCISEALDHAPSVIIFDDLDNVIVPPSELKGSQSSNSSAALVGFIADILDTYQKERSACGIGPIAFIATAQSLTSFPQILSSSGRFDFHVKLPAPAAAMLKREIQNRSLQCSDDVLLDIASKCDGYDAYDLGILVDRSILAAIYRSFCDWDIK